MRRSEKLRAIGSEARGDPETGMVFCLSEAVMRTHSRPP